MFDLVEPQVIGARMFTSEQLKVNEIYTRSQLREKFGVKDATINNGIFRPRGHDSIWLFVTEEKTKDRTQYTDEFSGDDLYFDGQTAGLRDMMLVEHEEHGLEVIVFHRKAKYEYPGAGFRYEGRFRYVEHHGGRPAHFHFRRLKS
jgi:putative restriction endonuclease